MKKRKQSNNTPLFLGLAFLLPFAIMTGLLAIKGIWWNSKVSILASDSFHQYVIFYQALRNALHGDGSLFYNFTSGIGLNFYALSSYYLGSFLSPFAYFFDLKSMPDFIYLSTIVKFGLIGLSSYYSLSSIYKRIQPLFLLFLSTSFALLSFATSQMEIVVWLDIFILLPLIVLGLHRLMTGQGRILYFFSLVCLFIQNYYFGYMAGLFIGLWFFVQVSWNPKARIKKIVDFTIVSILALLSSLVMLLPTYLDLKTHGETLSSITSWKTENSWYLDIFAKHVVGAYDTTKFGSIPMLSVGLLPLLLAILFFTFPSIKKQVKISYGLLLALVVASFYLQPLDLFWQGMHAPNMFLHRYAWVFSLIIIYMAAESLERIHQLKPKQFLIPFLIYILGFSATFFFNNRYVYLTRMQFILTAEFILAYGLLFLLFFKGRVKIRLFALMVLAFAAFEMGLHSYYQIDSLSKEWHFPDRSSYEHQLTDIDNFVKEMNKQEDHFYRAERLEPQTGNDSMKYNYNGISQFSSIRNRSSSSTLDKLGFRSDGTNLNLRYQNNTLIGDSLLGIHYNFSSTDPLKYSFKPILTEQSLTLYKNTAASQLAILTEGVYKDVEFTNLTLDNQTNFLNQLTQLNRQFYYSLTPTGSQDAVEQDGRVTVQSKENDPTARASYSLTVPANRQVYISLPNLQFSNENSKRIQITVNDVTNNFGIDNSFSFFNVGYFMQDTDTTITISFPDNAQVSFDTPQFYSLDLNAYDIAMYLLNSKDLAVTSKGNTVTADFTSDREASLLFTLPYDKGWSARLNGKKVPIKRAQTGFMKVDVPEGKGKVVLTFVPQGFYLGLSAFFVGIVLFIAYDFGRKKALFSRLIGFKDKKTSTS